MLGRSAETPVAARIWVEPEGEIAENVRALREVLANPVVSRDFKKLASKELERIMLTHGVFLQAR